MSYRISGMRRRTVQSDRNALNGNVSLVSLHTANELALAVSVHFSSVYFFRSVHALKFVLSRVQRMRLLTVLIACFMFPPGTDSRPAFSRPRSRFFVSSSCSRGGPHLWFLLIFFLQREHPVPSTRCRFTGI